MGGSELAIVALHVRFMDFSIPYATSYLLLEASVPFKGSLLYFVVVVEFVNLGTKIICPLANHTQP